MFSCPGSSSMLHNSSSSSSCSCQPMLQRAASTVGSSCSSSVKFIKLSIHSSSCVQSVGSSGDAVSFSSNGRQQNFSSSNFTPQQQQQQPQQQQALWQQQPPILQQPADAMQQPWQQQQRRGYRRATSSTPNLLQKREALARQQQGQAEQYWEDRRDGWFSEQQLGTWQQQQPPSVQQQEQQVGDWQQPLLPQQQQQLDEYYDYDVDIGDADVEVPVRFVSRRWGKGHKNGAAWFEQSQYLNPKALHAAILDRSGRGQLEVAAVTHLVRIAGSSRDAALALSAISAAREVAIAQGRVEPWSDAFVKAFVRMTVLCDCHEVLVSAMQRPNELGFVFKWKSLNLAYKHWGNKLALHKLEQITQVVKDAGLQPDARMAYALVRACVNAKQWEKLDEVQAWFAAQGVTSYKPAMEALLAKAAAERNGQDQQQQQP